MLRKKIGLILIALVFSSAVYANYNGISLSSRDMNFGEVELGDNKVLVLTIFNSGDNELTVTGINITNFSFQVSESSFVILPGEEKKLSLTFSPSTLGALSGILTFNWSAHDSVDNTVILSGEGIPRKDPLISVSQDTLNFGEVEIDSYRELNLTVYNTGDDTLLIGSFNFTKTSYFIYGSDRTIAPGALSVYTIRFSPKSIAVKDGFLEIFSNDLTQNPYRILLTAIGKRKKLPIISLSKTKINFGTLIVGNNYEDIVKIYNNGAGDLIIKDIEITQPGISAVLSDSIIEASGSGDLNININAISPGEVETNLAVYSNDIANSVLNIRIEGSIKSTPRPDISVSTDTIDYRYVFLDSVKSNTLMIQNTGETALTISNIFISDKSFSVSPSSFTLQPGQSKTITVTFNPDELRYYFTNMFIKSNDPDKPLYSIILKGNCKELPSANILVYPTQIDFEEVELKETGEKKLLITNDGELPLEIHEFEFSDASFFTDISEMTVDAGNTDTLILKFKPEQADFYTGWVKIKSNALDSIMVVDLHGNGIFVPYAILEVNPVTLNYGLIYTDEDNEYLIELENTGELPVSIANINTGLGILQVNLGSGNISPGEKTNLSVNLNYNQTGDFIDTLVIESNSKYGPIKIPVSASLEIRFQSIIDVNKQNVDFGSVLVNNSKTLEFIVYNNGNSNLIITSVTSGNKYFSGMIENSTVSPSDSTKLFISFYPEEEIIYPGEIILNNNSRIDPNFKVYISGTGLIPDIVDTVFVYLKENEFSKPVELTYFLEDELYTFENYTGRFTFLNGSAIKFPRGSLKENFNLSVSIPFANEIANIEMKERELISIVKFSNLGDSTLYVIKKPVFVQIPVDLSKLELYNINIDSVTVSLYDGNFLFDESGVDNIYLDKNNYVISGDINYLSILAVTSVRRVKEGYKGFKILELRQNFPNPFNGETVIRYKVNLESNISIDIYNSLGQHIKTLVDKYHRPGFYLAKWNGHNKNDVTVSSGTYYYRIKSTDFTITKSMQFVK